jgi:hypothetical protein
MPSRQELPVDPSPTGGGVLASLVVGEPDELPTPPPLELPPLLPPLPLPEGGFIMAPLPLPVPLPLPELVPLPLPVDPLLVPPPLPEPPVLVIAPLLPTELPGAGLFPDTVEEVAGLLEYPWFLSELPHARPAIAIARKAVDSGGLPKL